MEDDSNPLSPPSVRHQLKESLCFSCCFRRRDGGHLPLHHTLPIWIEIKEKCRTVLGFAGAKHKRQSAVEFRYDPLSYALNFEDGFDCDDEAPLKNFSARLPPSPLIPAAVG